MNGLARFHSPTEVLFGFGAAAKLPEELAAMGFRSPQFLVDEHVAAAEGIIQACARDMAVDASTYAADTEEARWRGLAGIAAARGTDVIVAVGGGTTMDGAKLVSVLAVMPQGVPLADLDCMAGGRERLDRHAGGFLPVIAVPTTAGTGSEVSPAAMVQPAAGPPRKIMLLSRRLIPRLAVCDPELALSCPDALAAGAGMDALSHGIEVFLSPRPHPALDAVALEVVRRTAADLPALLAAPAGSPQRRERTADMMMSALMAGMGFEKGVGLVHCLSHPLSALAGAHHGTANAVLLPAALRFQSAAVAGKMQRLGRAFADAGLPADPAVAVAEINRRVGMPAGLSAMGVAAEVLETAAAQAVRDPCRLTAPVRFRADDALRLLRESL